eukprot:Gb_16138 [translate_table: standard]
MQETRDHDINHLRKRVFLIFGHTPFPRTKISKILACKSRYIIPKVNLSTAATWTSKHRPAARIGCQQTKVNNVIHTHTEITRRSHETPGDRSSAPTLTGSAATSNAFPHIIYSSTQNPLMTGLSPWIDLWDSNSRFAMRAPSLFACLPGLSPHSLFQSTDKAHSLCGSPERPLRPPPPSVEVLPSKDDQSEKYVAESVKLQGGLTLLKGRVNTADVFGVSNSDLVPGKYEGGLKLWESSVDLVNTLKREIQDGQLSFRGKRVLELGCGHGLPGIFACLKGASVIHFQDFNAEVLRYLTIPNVYANLQHARERHGRHCDGPVTPTRSTTLSPDVHFYAGDWGELHTVLSVVGPDQLDTTCEINFSFSEDDFLDRCNNHNGSGDNQETQRDSNQSQQVRRTRKLSGSRACERASDTDPSEGGYDIILMAETVYSQASMRKLYDLIKKCLRPPYGVVYLAAKKHYYGLGGGTRQFRSLVEEDGKCY